MKEVKIVSLIAFVIIVWGCSLAIMGFAMLS